MTEGTEREDAMRKLQSRMVSAFESGYSQLKTESLIEVSYCESLTLRVNQLVDQLREANRQLEEAIVK